MTQSQRNEPPAINESELRIDIYRHTGYLNWVENEERAIRVTHIPSGIVATRKHADSLAAARAAKAAAIEDIAAQLYIRSKREGEGATP